jgi:YidC/Oxa1 family membrane protein insertase
MEHANYFLGINIANSPSDLIRSGWSAGQYLLVFGAILVPVLSALTQFINVKLMPTANTTENTSGNDQANAMASSMKTMNYMMPFMSFIFVFSLPVGMGIYWIAGAVIRCIQQLLINKHMEKIDLDDIIKKNQAKAKKKREKKGISENQISNMARMNTRTMSDKANIGSSKTKSEVKESDVSTASKTYKEGSLAAKANMVRDFNERNNKQ